MGQQLNKAQIGGAGGTRPDGRVSGRTRYLLPPATAALADEAGGAGGTRTRDFCLAKAALSQLSYSPSSLVLGERNRSPATAASDPLFAQQIAELPGRSIEGTLQLLVDGLFRELRD